MQRLYLALEPGYQFVVNDLVSLALWEDKSRSLGFCLVSATTDLQRLLADDHFTLGLLGVVDTQPAVTLLHLLYALCPLASKDVPIS